jgi:hypothetical protein
LVVGAQHAGFSFLPERVDVFIGTGVFGVSETVVFTDGLWFFVRNVLAVEGVVLLGHLSLLLPECFVLNLEEVCEFLHSDLSFGEILKQMID